MVGQIFRTSDGVLEIRNLAGSSSDGLPIGSVLALHDTRVPFGFLPCNGSEFDTTLYPALYTLLRTNKLPDLREMNLVGIGTNETHTIAAHDVYTLGQFKDDQIQCHNHMLNVTPYISGSCSVNDLSPERFNCDAAYPYVNNTSTSGGTGRYGTTTHGKNYGVFYVIKAVTGAVDIDDAQVFAEVQAFLEDNYTKTNFTNFLNGAIAKWDAQNNEWVPITYPTGSGTLLTSNVSTTTTHDYYYTIDNASYFGPDLEAKALPAGTPTTTAVVDTGIVYYNEKFYKYDSGDWKIVDDFTTAGAEATVTVSDSDLIDALDALTKSNLTIIDFAESTNSYDYCWTDTSSISPTIECVEDGYYPLMVANENCPQDFYRLNCVCTNGVTASFVCDIEMGDNTYFNICGRCSASQLATYVDVNKSTARIGSCNATTNGGVTTVGGAIDTCSRWNGGTATTNATSGNHIEGRYNCSWSCSNNCCCKTYANMCPTKFEVKSCNCCTNCNTSFEVAPDHIQGYSGNDSGLTLYKNSVNLFSCDCGVNSHAFVNSTGVAMIRSGDDEYCNSLTCHMGCCGRRIVLVHRTDVSDDNILASHCEETCVPSTDSSTTTFEDAAINLTTNTFVKSGITNVACNVATSAYAKLYFICCDGSCPPVANCVVVGRHGTCITNDNSTWSFTDTLDANLPQSRFWVGDCIRHNYSCDGDVTCTVLGSPSGNTLTTCVVDANGCACRSGICTSALGITEFVDNLNGNGAAAIHTAQTSYDSNVTSIIQSSDSNGSYVDICGGDVTIDACTIDLSGDVCVGGDVCSDLCVCGCLYANFPSVTWSIDPTTWCVSYS